MCAPPHFPPSSLLAALLVRGPLKAMCYIDAVEMACPSASRDRGKAFLGRPVSDVSDLGTHASPGTLTCALELVLGVTSTIKFRECVRCMSGLRGVWRGEQLSAHGVGNEITHRVEGSPVRWVPYTCRRRVLSRG